MAKATAFDLTTVFQGASVPVYVVDAQFRVVFANPACEALLGQSADRLLGLQCTYHSTSSSDPLVSLAASLCPPPAVVEHGGGEATVVLMVGPESFIERRIVWDVSHDRAGSLLGIVGFVFDPLPGARGSCAEPAGRAISVDWHRKLATLRRELASGYGFDQLIGQSAAMRTVLEQVRLAATCDLPVLIRGEPGTGKELAARTVHYAGRRRDAPLVPLDCAAIPAEVLDRTLARLITAESDAEPQYLRGLSLAGGTLLVQEVTALPRDAQARITRAALALRAAPSEPQEHAKPAGQERRVAVRLIATSSTDLPTACRQGLLREQLYHALRALIIELPPLRQRRDDVALLAQHFLEQQNERGGRQVGSIAPDALELLQRHDWPGNVRELSEVMAAAHSAATGSRLNVSDLPLRLRSAVDAASLPPPKSDQPIDLDALLTKAEIKLMERALSSARGNKSRAAELLGISRPRLYRRMVQLKLDTPGTPAQPRPSERNRGAVR